MVFSPPVTTGCPHQQDRRPVTERLELFFSVLAIGCNIAALGLLVALVLRRRSAAVNQMLNDVQPYALPLAAVVATTAMLGSLYFSEIANFVPCRLCWYQRAFMYPLAILLIAAAIKRWDKVNRIVLPMALVGVSISTYHVLYEQGKIGSDVCAADATPCTFPWFERIPWVTLAYMAGSAFVVIALLVSIRPREV
jgi:disulfide bond formation protein DsbB